MILSDTKPTVLPPVDAAETLRLMEALSAIGGGPDGSMHRETLTETDGRARDWLKAEMEAAGMTVTVDPMGNMYGLLDLAGPDAPLVMSGSHIDSQPNGGRFDGAYGVVAALAAIKAVAAHAEATGTTPKANFMVVNWTNEEGARFQPSLLGSGVCCGQLELDFAYSRVDGDGVSVSEALDAIGYKGTDPYVNDAAALIEIHVEGADNLNRTGKRLGAIRRWWGATKYKLAFTGRQAHTGPTPMAERRDALLAAAHVIADVRAFVEPGDLELHTSVGRLAVYPNSPNVVPSEAVLSIELRSPDKEKLAAVEAKLNASIEAAAALAGVGYEIRQLDRRNAGDMSPGLIEIAGEVAAAKGEGFLVQDSTAGNDSYCTAERFPSLCIQVPSVGGVIHHPDEFTTEEDRQFGVEVVAAMLWKFLEGGDVLAGRK